MTGDYKVSVFNYTNYRAFLQDFYEKAKKERVGFSYRRFAKKADLKSQTLLPRVISGHRNITGATLPKFIQGLELKGEEARYFESLVRYNNADTNKEKNYHFAEMRKLLERRHINTLSLKEYDLLSHWFVPVIREAVPCKSFSDKPEKIAKFLMNEVSPVEVREALRLLAELKMIEARKDGTLVPKHRHLKTDDEIHHLSIKNYHREMIDLAKKSIDKSKARERELQALTIGVDPNKIPQAKKMIQEFVHNMRDFLTGPECTQVYQLNVQLFNVTEEGFEDE